MTRLRRQYANLARMIYARKKNDDTVSIGEWARRSEAVPSGCQIGNLKWQIWNLRSAS